MTTTNTNNNEQKQRAPKFLLNDDAKQELYSLRQALNMVKIAYDCGEHKEQTREYVKSLGYSANALKALKHENLKEFATTKSGRFSPYAAICALVKYAKAHDLTGEYAAKQARKEERAKLAEAKKRIEEKKRIAREQDKAERKAKNNATPKNA